MRFIILTAFLSSFTLFSQIQDAELWTGLGLKTSFGKTSLKYETQTRFYKNASVLKTYYNELSGEYEVIKNLSLGLSYRFSVRDKESYRINDNRFCFNAEYGDKIKNLDLKLKARARYQFDFDRLSPINDIIYPDKRNTFRLKLELQYEHDDFKRVSPYVGYELFKALQPTQYATLDAYRVFGGLDFDLPARHEIGLKYIFELENGSAPKIAHCYIIQYNYDISSKLYRKKKKK